MTDWSDKTRDRIEQLIVLSGKLGNDNGRLREYRQVREELLSLRESMCRSLAEERGWRVAKTDFSLRQLLAGHAGRYLSADYLGTRHYPEIDHEECFRVPVRPYRPAAILTHSYAPQGEVLEFAERCGFDAEVLPWSWYYPSSCVAVLLTRRAG
jgi:hypothetical protein